MLNTSILFTRNANFINSIYQDSPSSNITPLTGSVNIYKKRKVDQRHVGVLSKGRRLPAVLKSCVTCNVKCSICTSIFLV